MRVQKWLRDGVLPAMKVPGDWRVLRIVAEELDAGAQAGADPNWEGRALHDPLQAAMAKRCDWRWWDIDPAGCKRVVMLSSPEVQATYGLSPRKR